MKLLQELSALNEGKNPQFYATGDHEIHDDEMWVLVKSDVNDDNADYYGNNVLLRADGHIDTSFGDDIAAKEWDDYMARIVATAVAWAKKKYPAELKKLGHLNEAAVVAAAPARTKVNKVVQVAKAGDVDEFMHVFADSYDSAADLWLSAAKQKKLMKMFADGVTVKSVTDSVGGATAAKQKQKMTAAGWKLFDEEFNMDSYEAIYFKPATPVTEAEERTVELTDDTVGKIDHTVWPKGVTYKGRNVFDSVYENRPMALTHAEKLLKADDTDWDNRLEFQEVYLGYSPSKDVFIQGYDGWMGDGNCSPFIIFTMNAGGDVKVVQKGKDITRAGAMWYGQGSRGGHLAAKRRFPDLIDIRLD